MNRTLPIILLTLLFSACGGHGQVYIPETPDYSDASLWYVSREGTVEETPADVFYVTPTCIYDWTEPKTGLPCHHYDVYGEVQKKNFDWSLQLADEIFGQDCNFYAPYYRQISLNSWMEGVEVAEERFGIAMKDVEDAFRHYLDASAPDRPFILAGFSQGAKAVLELVKSMDGETLTRMKAAYVIGNKVTAEDLEHPNVRPAVGESDQGVVVTYNSVRSVEDIWPSVAGGTCCCINPVNWRTDTLSARIPGTGANDIVVRVNPEFHVLEVSGYDGGGMKISAFDGEVPPGNYHLSELTLYRSCLQENVKKRLE